MFLHLILHKDKILCNLANSNPVLLKKTVVESKLCIMQLLDCFTCKQHPQLKKREQNRSYKFSNQQLILEIYNTLNMVIILKKVFYYKIICSGVVSVYSSITFCITT